MACEDADFAPRALSVMGPQNGWVQAVADNDRWLILSGAPEKILSSQSTLPRRLYACEIPIPAGGQLDCRVYVWHVNICTFSLRVAAILRLSEDVDATAALVNHRWKRHFALRDDPAGIGRCMARWILFDSLDQGVPASVTLEPGVDFVLPPQGSQFQPERVLGVIHEFSIVGTPGHRVSIRTVASATADFGGPGIDIFAQEEPPPPGPPKPVVHQRGSWPYSQLLVTVDGIAFDAAGTTQSQKDRRGCGETGGPEVTKYAWRGKDEDEHGSKGGNKALRGVLCRHRVLAENTDASHGREIAAFLRARRTGNFWQGAALAFEEEPSSVRAGVVPPIRRSIPDEVAVKLNQTQISEAATTDLTVRIVHGSSGSLPVDLIYWSGPVGTPIDPPPDDGEGG